jgi:hypothetical protein
MKRLALCLVAFSLLALSGCVTYKYFDETETRQLSNDQVFRKASSASQFKVADGAGGWGIRLAYADSYDVYEVTKHASYQVNYRIPTTYVLIVYYRGEKEKTGETETKEWSTEGAAQKNAKTEQKTIAKGQTVTLSFPYQHGEKRTFTLDQDGVLPLDDAVCTQILSAIDSLSDLKSVKVESASLGLSQTLDLSTAPLFHDAISASDNLNRTLASYKIAPTDPQQRYEESQGAILALVKTCRYGYQRRLGQAVFDANYQTVVKALQAQIDSLQASIPTFIIQGQINDTGDGWIQVWGTATPRPMTAQTMRLLGFQNRPANLIVESPDDSGIRGNAYVFMTNYFVAKESGVNSLGGTVPVYRYTTKMPASYQPVNAQITDLQATLDSLSKVHTDAASLFRAE